MIRRPPRSTRTDTLFPYTTLFRSTTENIKVAMKTFTAKNETVQRDWYVVDATGKTLGRLRAEPAHRLPGKHKPVYTPPVDTSDHHAVLNAEKIHVTGTKLADQMYSHQSEKRRDGKECVSQSRTR